MELGRQNSEPSRAGPSASFCPIVGFPSKVLALPSFEPSVVTKPGPYPPPGHRDESAIGPAPLAQVTASTSPPGTAEVEIGASRGGAHWAGQALRKTLGKLIGSDPGDEEEGVKWRKGVRSVQTWGRAGAKTQRYEKAWLLGITIADLAQG